MNKTQQEILNKVWNPATPYLLISRPLQPKDLAVIWGKAYFGATPCPVQLINEQELPLIEVGSKSVDIDIEYVVAALKEQGINVYGAVQTFTIGGDEVIIYFLSKPTNPEEYGLFFYEHELDTLQLAAAIDESKTLLIRLCNPQP